MIIQRGQLCYLATPAELCCSAGVARVFCDLKQTLGVKLSSSLTRAHSYPSTSLAGSQTQLSFEEEEEEEQRVEGKVDEEEWGGVSETSSAETIKTASHLALPR